ncbi:hypothetical protein Tco_0513993, partial [Tanacetum coccineum]
SNRKEEEIDEELERESREKEKRKKERLDCTMRKERTTNLSPCVEKGIYSALATLGRLRTEYQLADLFTKALSQDRFEYHVKRLGMRCLTPTELEVLTNESACDDGNPASANVKRTLKKVLLELLLDYYLADRVAPAGMNQYQELLHGAAEFAECDVTAARAAGQFSKAEKIMPGLQVAINCVKRMFSDSKLADLLADLRSSVEDSLFGDCTLGVLFMLLFMDLVDLYHSGFEKLICNKLRLCDVFFDLSWRKFHACCWRTS